MRTVTKKRGKEYGVENEAGNTLIWPHVTTKGVVRDAAKRLAEKRGESVYIFEVGEDKDGTSIVVDRTEVSPTAARSRHHATKKSPSQLQRDIDEVLGRWEEDPFGGHRFITTSDGIRFDTAGVDPTYYRDSKWRQRWEFDLKREIEKLKAGKSTKLYKMSETHYRLPGIV